MSDLIRYPKDLEIFGKIPKDSVKIPSDYFSFLADYNMNDNEFISIKHANFLHSYFRYVKRHPKDSLAKAYQLYKQGEIIKGAQIQMNMITQITSGFTKDLMLSKFYFSAIAGKQLKEFEALYDSTIVSTDYLKRYIKYEYLKLQEYMSNQTPVGANLSSINSNLVKGLIDNINKI